MRRPAQTKPPSFLWQGLLIVLPVVLLAALGLLSLRQDRRLAEQDAQDRARELLRQLAPELARSVGIELAPVPGFRPRVGKDQNDLAPNAPDE